MSEQDATAQAPQEPDVEPRLEDGFYGFIATNPKFSDENGKPTLFFRAGQIHFDFIDGERVQLPTTFHNVVAFDGAAVHGSTHLQKRDIFMAFGRLDDKPHPETGASRLRFIANRFGHDMARMNCEVGTPRRVVDMQQPERERPERERTRNVGFESMEQEQPEHEPHVRAM